MKHPGSGVLRRVAIALAASGFALALPAAATIEYRVSVAAPSEHILRVTMTIPDVKSAVDVQMPAWNALYQIRDFASRVMDVKAHDANGKPLAVAKSDTMTWRISGGKSVVVSYGVLWDEQGPFATQLNSEHAFLNLAMALFYVPDRRDEEARVTFSDLPAGWEIAVALAPDGQAATFRAAGYDELVDAPVEIGRFEQFRFTVGRARIRVVVHGTSWRRETLEAKLRRIVEYQVTLMEDVPFEEFLFIYHFDSGGGGMEHANSTAIHTAGDSNVEGISAHEFFHLWNVKRIRPNTLEPVDYTRANITRALWFAEGVTNTYEAYTLVRTGMRSAQEFYAGLAGEIAQLEARPASRWKNAEEASLDAWLESYRVYRRPELSISYYNKGEILGVLLDILIRDASDNRKSLDHVMRHLNAEYAQRGRYYEDSAGIRKAIEKITGVSFADFFARYVAGAEPLPYEDILRRAGLGFTQEGDGVRIEELPQATERQRRLRAGLLRGSTD
ncbi:MAG: M61 family metallopeptidase [Candidatus Acidiferrales bacterium]